MALQVRAISAYGGLYQSYCSNENTGSDYDGGELIVTWSICPLADTSSLRHLQHDRFVFYSMRRWWLCLCRGPISELLVLKLRAS